MAQLMKINLTVLQDYIDKGLVEKTCHPVLPIAIYNYSRQCQYAGAWDDYTLMCRGLIVENETGKIVARSFPKFFNYEEIAHKNIIPFDKTFWMSEKLDGSMLIIFYYNDKWHTATKASFNSEQALRGIKILNVLDVWEQFRTDLTYVGEVIYPENKIVVDYKGCENVVFITAFENETGRELTVDRFQVEMTNLYGITSVKYVLCESLKPEDIKFIKSCNIPNEEGYVFRTDSGFRFKAKFEDYVRLHRIITNCTSYDVWENLMNGTKMNLENIPDEFDAWLKFTESNILKQYNEIWSHIKLIFDLIKLVPNRKQFAENVTLLDKEYTRILFLLYDNKIEQAKQAVWKLCKPKFEKAGWFRSNVLDEE